MNYAEIFGMIAYMAYMTNGLIDIIVLFVSVAWGCSPTPGYTCYGDNKRDPWSQKEKKNSISNIKLKIETQVKNARNFQI